VQSATLLFGEVIAFVVDHQVDNCPVGQGCGLVENEPALFDTRSKTAHLPTVRVSQVPGKRSGCKMKSLDLARPGDSWVPTGWRSRPRITAPRTAPVPGRFLVNLRTSRKSGVRSTTNEIADHSSSGVRRDRRPERFKSCASASSATPAWSKALVFHEFAHRLTRPRVPSSPRLSRTELTQLVEAAAEVALADDGVPAIHALGLAVTGAAVSAP
jgi:hypothetical protein